MERMEKNGDKPSFSPTFHLDAHVLVIAIRVLDWQPNHVYKVKQLPDDLQSFRRSSEAA